MPSSIKHIEYFLPENILSNEKLQLEFPDSDVPKMANKIGVFSRHIVTESQTALDLAESACNKLFDTYDKNEIDFIVLCTQSPDYYLPTSACILQERLGLPTGVGAFDINQGCSGFIYALTIAKGFISSGVANNVLLVMAETYSKHLNPKDLGNRLIFGDGASAIVVGKDKKEKIGDFVLGTNGEGHKNLIVPNGGMKCRYDYGAETIIGDRNEERTANDLYMNGSEIFYFVSKQIPGVVKKVLEKNNFVQSDIDFFIFHQANEYMIDFLTKRLKIPKDKYYNNIQNTGNTVSSTIPIALKESMDKNLVKKGDKIMLCGFGVGYSWGAVTIEL